MSDDPIAHEQLTSDPQILLFTLSSKWWLEPVEIFNQPKKLHPNQTQSYSTTPSIYRFKFSDNYIHLLYLILDPDHQPICSQQYMEYFTNVNLIVVETEYLLPIKYFGIRPPPLPPKKMTTTSHTFFKY